MFYMPAAEEGTSLKTAFPSSNWALAGGAPQITPIFVECTQKKGFREDFGSKGTLTYGRTLKFQLRTASKPAVKF